MKTPLSAETIVSQNICEVIFVVISKMDPVTVLIDQMVVIMLRQQAFGDYLTDHSSLLRKRGLEKRLVFVWLRITIKHNMQLN